jgi:hypothetical protein
VLLTQGNVLCKSVGFIAIFTSFYTSKHNLSLNFFLKLSLSFNAKIQHFFIILNGINQDQHIIYLCIIQMAEKQPSAMLY